MDKSKIRLDMNFCRRCGSPLRQKQGHVYVCQQEHLLFANASPAVGVWLLNDKGEVLVLERAIDPGKGGYDAPGGFCDGPEAPEEAVVRELQEEIGFQSSDYTKPQYILSGVEGYDFRGEILPVCSILFWAKLTTNKQPVADDDAAAALWLPLQTVDLAKIYFPVVRAAMVRLQRMAPSQV